MIKPHAKNQPITSLCLYLQLNVSENTQATVKIHFCFSGFSKVYWTSKHKKDQKDAAWWILILWKHDCIISKRNYSSGKTHLSREDVFKERMSTNATHNRTPLGEDHIKDKLLNTKCSFPQDFFFKRTFQNQGKKKKDCSHNTTLLESHFPTFLLLPLWAQYEISEARLFCFPNDSSVMRFPHIIVMS